MTDEEFEKAQQAYEAWRKANEVVHRLAATLLELGRDYLTPAESAAALLDAQRMTCRYKHGHPRTFIWPVGGFIEQVKL